MVSFARYGKKEFLRNGSDNMETGKKEDPVGGGGIYTSSARDKRSFKEVVEGCPQLPKFDGQSRGNSSKAKANNEGESSR